MIVFLVVIVVLFLLRGSGGVAGIAAANTSVIQNATGGSLSNALGSATAPPSAYAIGSPGAAPTIVNQQPIGSSIAAAVPVASPGVLPVNHGTSPVPVSQLRRPTWGTSLVNNPNNTPVVLPKFVGATPVSARANPISQIVRGAPNVPVPGPNNPNGTYSPVLANRPVTFTRNSPEATSSFFAKSPLPLVIQRKITGQ